MAAIAHYWCHHIFIKKMQAEDTSDMAFFKHQYCTKLMSTPKQAIIRALSNIKAAITNKANCME